MHIVVRRLHSYKLLDYVPEWNLSCRMQNIADQIQNPVEHHISYHNGYLKDGSPTFYATESNLLVKCDTWFRFSIEIAFLCKCLFLF